MAKNKYNLLALQDRKVTATITAYLNGMADDDEVSEQLDKIFILPEDPEEPTEPEDPENPEEPKEGE